MKRQESLFLLLVPCLLLPGCAPPRGASSPKKLANAVVAALKRNDPEAFLRLCLTPKDAPKLIRASSLSDERKKREIDKIRNDADLPKQLEDARRANFTQIAGRSDWSKAVVRSVVLGQMGTRDGIPFYDYVRVQFKDNALPDLRIDTVVRISGRWKIAEETPLRLR
jgi:hypothetical protein